MVLIVLADGMARLSTRQEPMGGVGNGGGMEARQGAIEIFLEDRVRRMGSGCTQEPATRNT